MPPSGADGWISLLNGHDLSGWYTMLQKAGKSVAEKKGMVAMEEGMLHIMGNEEGGEPAEPGTWRPIKNLKMCTFVSSTSGG